MTKTAQELADEAKRLAAKLFDTSFAESTAAFAPLLTTIDALLSLAQASQARTDGGADNAMQQSRCPVCLGPFPCQHSLTSTTAGWALATPPGNATQAANTALPEVLSCTGGRNGLTSVWVSFEGEKIQLFRNYSSIASPAAELKKD